MSDDESEETEHIQYEYTNNNLLRKEYRIKIPDIYADKEIKYVKLHFDIHSNNNNGLLRTTNNNHIESVNDNLDYHLFSIDKWVTVICIGCPRYSLVGDTSIGIDFPKISSEPQRFLSKRPYSYILMSNYRSHQREIIYQISPTDECRQSFPNLDENHFMDGIQEHKENGLVVARFVPICMNEKNRLKCPFGYMTYINLTKIGKQHNYYPIKKHGDDDCYLIPENDFTHKFNEFKKAMSDTQVTINLNDYKIRFHPNNNTVKFVGSVSFDFFYIEK